MADNRNKIEKKPRNSRLPAPMGSSNRGAGSPDDNETNGYYANAARNFRYREIFNDTAAHYLSSVYNLVQPTGDNH